MTVLHELVCNSWIKSSHGESAFAWSSRVEQMEEMTLEYELTWEEFRRSQMGASRGKPILLNVVVCFSLLILAALEASDHAWIWLALTVAFVAWFLSASLWIGPKRAWKVGIGAQEPRTVTFSNDGIDRASESLKIRLEWTRFSSVRETNDFFIFVPKKSQSSFSIPKRVFRSQDDEEAFRSLVEKHLESAPSDRRFFIGILLLVLAVLFALGDYIAFRFLHH